MKFDLLDRVVSLTNVQIVAVKQVSLAEEYLADHFPTFPVLPGVLMLEAATQAAGWLMHHRTGFAKSMAVLKEARNLKYGNFVAPGSVLKVTCDWVKDHTADGAVAGAQFKVSGEVSPAGAPSGTSAFAGKIDLAYFNLADKSAADASVDAGLIAHSRQRWGLVAPVDVSTKSVVAV